MLLRMFEKRLVAYRAIGYARGEAPLGFAEPPEERIIEYDEEALRQNVTKLEMDSEMLGGGKIRRRRMGRRLSQVPNTCQ